MLVLSEAGRLFIFAAATVRTVKAAVCRPSAFVLFRPVSHNRLDYCAIPHWICGRHPFVFVPLRIRCASCIATAVVLVFSKANAAFPRTTPGLRTIFTVLFGVFALWRLCNHVREYGLTVPCLFVSVLPVPVLPNPVWRA